MDLYVAGHVHAYFRSLPVYNNIVAPSYTDAAFPTYLIVGGAGCDEMPVASPAPSTNPAWLAAQSRTFGTGLLHVQNATTLVWEWYVWKRGGGGGWRPSLHATHARHASSESQPTRVLWPAPALARQGSVALELHPSRDRALVPCVSLAGRRFDSASGTVVDSVTITKAAQA